MTVERKINDLIPLFNSKQYGKLIFEIERNFDDKEINSQVLLILGLARMKSLGRKLKDILLATQNFKQGYILDKKSKIGLECLRYYFYSINENISFLCKIYLIIILIFKLGCWSCIRICLCLKPYIFISRLMSMPS